MSIPSLHGLNVLNKHKPQIRPIFQVTVSSKGSKIWLIKDGGLDSSRPPSLFVVETGESRTPRPIEETQNLLQDYSDL